MPTFGQLSTTKLNTCDPRLVQLFLEVIKTYNCVVLAGARSIAEEQANIDKGTSKLTNPMDSKHVVDPATRPLALAADVAPYTDILTVDWNDKPRFYHFAGYVKRTAEQLGLIIRWGGAWKGTLNKPGDFNDLDHFELFGGGSV